MFLTQLNFMGQQQHVFFFFSISKYPLWIHLVKKDKIINISDEQIEAFSRYEFKKLIKSKVRSSLFVELERVKEGHSKVKNIIHTETRYPQKYLTDARFSNKETSLLFNLRSQCVNEFRSNFFISKCQLCKSCEDSQEHALVCHLLGSHMKTEHEKT